MTAWKEYLQLAEPGMRQVMKRKYLVDVRYSFKQDQFEAPFYISL